MVLLRDCILCVCHKQFDSQVREEPVFLDEKNLYAENAHAVMSTLFSRRVLMCCVFLQDYFDIVKNPMDLSTIKRKLDTGQYQEPWQYVDDIWLMFNNAWLYNRKTSRVYKYCSKLAEVFEQEIDPVMQSLGYCCGRKVRKYISLICCLFPWIEGGKYRSCSCYQLWCVKNFWSLPGFSNFE